VSKTNTLVNPESTQDSILPLTASDRCDAGSLGGACGAQALVRATLSSGGVLLFCGHHYKKNNAGLASAGARIDDYSDLIDS
jgi:hypothetical protein